MKPLCRRLLAIALGLASISCAWVRLTPGGEQVRLVTAAEASGCERIGQVSSSTQNRVGVFARSEQKVEGELAYLARNEASAMGGDAISILDPAADGRQSFAVYRCDN